MTKLASKRLKAGDFAPDFSLRNQLGELVSLSQFFNKKAVVLFFYPKDDTPVCTREAQCFRDHYEDFQALGAEVLGISSDADRSHLCFANKHRLPFSLLSDPGGKVRELYGVPQNFWFFPGRVTFVIHPNGKILHIFSSQFRARQHVIEALEILRNNL